MNMIFKAFTRKLSGSRGEQFKQTIPVCLILFWGLSISDFQIRIAPFLLYLMVSALTAGVMWQALSSDDLAAYMQNLFMLPFERRKLIFSYVFALGVYAFLTKTAVLLTIVLAVSAWSAEEILGCLLCLANAILMSAGIFSLKRHWLACSLWGAAVTAVIFLLWDQPWFLPLMAANCLLALFLLQRADGYSFYLPERRLHRPVKIHRRACIWLYLVRYLSSHKNYLVNTAAMWCAACVLPLLFRQMKDLFVAPIGFAILSLNTPLCILLSCDPALEQAVRFLPGQKKVFFVPYCLFLFLYNLVADGIFLCSWQIQNSNVSGLMLLSALFFAMQGAICSALLEWFFPIRAWKTESDLWHHPRKYVVPAAMLLLAGIVGSIPWIVYLLLILLAVQIAIFLSY